MKPKRWKKNAKRKKLFVVVKVTCTRCQKRTLGGSGGGGKLPGQWGPWEKESPPPRWAKKIRGGEQGKEKKGGVSD